VISAIEMLLELQDVFRFRRAEQPAASVGLTPSQYSSAGKVRMGRITGIGKNNLRAIVAVARTLLLPMRRMLLDRQAYALDPAA
jgi:transposase